MEKKDAVLLAKLAVKTAAYIGIAYVVSSAVVKQMQKDRTAS